MTDTPRKPFRPQQGRVASAAAVRRDGDEIRPSGPRPMPQPLIPENLRVHLPRGVRRAIDKQVPDSDVSRDVQRALTMAGELLEEGLGEEAVPLMAWAKAHAARVPEIREALGVAHYQAGDYRNALNELRTFRRMAASHGQDHLIADCLRGLGHPVHEVAAEVQTLLGADGVEPERQIEGVMVWSGAIRDSGDIAGARAVLRRADSDMVRRAGDEAEHRLAWLAAELAEADGDVEAARHGFGTLARLADDPWGAGPRLAALDHGDAGSRGVQDS